MLTVPASRQCQPGHHRAERLSTRVTETAAAAEAEEVPTFVIRAAVPGDMTALGAVFRRSARSDEGDWMNLLAHPEALEPSDLAVAEGRAGFAVSREAGTRFGPAPRMQVEMTS